MPAFIGPLSVICTVLAAGVLVVQWKRHWKSRFSRDQRLSIGCGGIVAVLVGFLSFPGLALLVNARWRTTIFIGAFIPVGIGWVFFGNVVMDAIWGRDDRDDSEPKR